MQAACHAGDRAHCRDVHCTDEQEPLGHRTAGHDLLELCGEANDFTSLRCLVAEYTGGVGLRAA